MRSREFVELVLRCMPSTKELEGYGLSEEEVEDVQQVFRCEPREHDPRREVRSELERLVTAYDCSRLGISLVRFVGSPEVRPDGVLVAYWEADPIVVLASGEVVAFDHAEPAAAPTPCAADSERFLDALGWLARAIADRASWRGRGSEVAEACGEKAGGDSYRAFFSSFCASLE